MLRHYNAEGGLSSRPFIELGSDVDRGVLHLDLKAIEGLPANKRNPSHSRKRDAMALPSLNKRPVVESLARL